MQNGFAFFLLLLSGFSWAQVDGSIENLNQTKLESIREIKSFAFGSCNNQNDPQPLWDDLNEIRPDLFAWAGDIIYADWERNYDIEKSYVDQKNLPAYKKFRLKTPIIGTWDDHDYAADNADGTNSEKVQNQKLLLDFLDEPRNSARRKQEGVYTSYSFGPSEREVKFILLDNRYFKNLEPNAPMLGETQWQWLEEEFKNSSAKIHFVMSGLSIFSPLIPYSEEWWHYPGEVNRLLALIEKYKPKGLVFLTGDKHFGTIFKGSGQLEMISSGMTHVVSRRAWWYLSRKYPVTYFGLNYGLIDIDWIKGDPRLIMRFRGTAKKDIYRQVYQWQEGDWKRITE